MSIYFALNYYLIYPLWSYDCLYALLFTTWCFCIMNSLLSTYIAKQWGKLWALQCYNDFGDVWYYFDGDWKRCPLNIQVPPTAILYRWKSISDYRISIKDILWPSIDFLKMLTRWDYAHMGMILRGSSPWDWDGHVDTHITTLTKECYFSETTDLDAVVDEIAQKVYELFDRCRYSTTCGVSPKLYWDVHTITEHPSYDIDELYTIDITEHNDNVIYKNSSDSIFLNQTTLNQCNALIKHIKQTLWLGHYALQLEAAVRSDKVLLYQIKCFSNKLRAVFVLADSDITQYIKQWFTHIGNVDRRSDKAYSYRRSYGITEPRWAILDCLYCYDHGVVWAEDPDLEYAVLVRNCGLEWVSAKNYSLRSIPYPAWKLVGYFGNSGQTSLLHNHTRYVMESLKNGWVACISPNLLETVFRKPWQGIQKVHVISDGKNLLMKNIK